MNESINNAKTEAQGLNIIIEDQILYGEKLLESRRNITEGGLWELISKLISIYNNPHYDNTLRVKATQVVSNLAKRFDQVIGLVIEDARKYVETQHIDDAFPYSPNSYNVLANIGRGNPKVISFLQDIVQNDWGIPRWEAINTLCQIDDPQADLIIIDIAKGKYPPKHFDLQFDLREIQNVKGFNFINLHNS